MYILVIYEKLINIMLEFGIFGSFLKFKKIWFNMMYYEVLLIINEYEVYVW